MGRAQDTTHGVAEILTRGFDEVRAPQIGRDVEQLLPCLLVGQGRNDRRHVAEGLVKAARLQLHGIPEIWPNRIQECMADFMRDDVGARAGERRFAVPVLMEERHAFPVVVRIHVFTLVGHHQ